MSVFGKLSIFGLTCGIGTSMASYLLLKERINGNVKAELCPKEQEERQLPSRSELINSLKNDQFDIVIIGGGASGAGCALDAVTRGLKTALVETNDFSCGTSSRSTKLIHGGVRYLQKAIMELDKEQYDMVKEALYERKGLLETAPHLTHALPIMLPVYKMWQVPYFWIGIKMYDLVAGRNNLKSSYFLSKKNALEIFPMLKSDKLCGGIVYYDGQKDDARLNLAICISAIRHGATVVNHICATDLIKSRSPNCREVINGITVKDQLTGESFNISAKCVINATGPFTDSIRQMDDPNAPNMCTSSIGAHITLPGYYSPEQMGLLDPATSDGRVIFFLPWQKHTLVGTTDIPCELTMTPSASEAQITFILNEIKNYLHPDFEVRRGDVLSAWGGIRSLVSDPNKTVTQELVRNYIILVSDSGLVTIAGGKWTTYRSMAQETIDAAIKATCLQPQISNSSQTKGFLLEGAHNWSPTMYVRLVQDFGIESEVARHLSNSYGDKAFTVAKLASATGQRWPIVGKRLHPEFPYIDADIRYGVREYALTAVDMIARRLRIAFLNVQATLEILPDILNIMAEELRWSEYEKQVQMDAAKKFLETEMGLNFKQMKNCNFKEFNLNREEIKYYIKRFESIDKQNKGFISTNDIRRNIKEIPGEELHKILTALDTNFHGQVQLNEYLQMMSAIKLGNLRDVKSKTDDKKELSPEIELLQRRIPVERSGGGV